MPAAFEIGGADLLLVEQLASASAQGDHPVDHDIAAVRELQGVKRVLLHEKDVELLLPVEGLDDAEYLTSDERRQSQRGLVQQQEPGAAHQCARDRQHLLLAPGQGAAALIAALLEAR